MAILCEISTTKPDGMEPRVDYLWWLSIYKLLGIEVMNVITLDKVKDLDARLHSMVEDNNGLIGPKDLALLPITLE